jgi:flagellar motor switch protein FliN/FliY
MAKKKVFDDPLHGIDPVLKDAFGVDVMSSVSHREEKKEEGIPKSKEPRSEAPAFSWDARAAESEGSSRPAVADVEFPVLTASANATGQKLEEDVFSRIPVTVSVELGRCQVSLKDVFELSDGAIVELDRLVGEPLDLVVNGQVIAQGEVVAVDNNYGLRITAIKSAPNA